MKPIEEVLTEIRFRVGYYEPEPYTYWAEAIERMIREAATLRDENHRMREALSKEHACLAMELSMIREHADSMHIKDLEWRRGFIRSALQKRSNNDD